MGIIQDDLRFFFSTKIILSMVSFLKEQDIDEDSMNDNRRIKMEKQFDDLNKDLIKKADQEVLEISSTGYGLESVSKETEEGQSSESHKNRNSPCEVYKIKAKSFRI